MKGCKRTRTPPITSSCRNRPRDSNASIPILRSLIAQPATLKNTHQSISRSLETPLTDEQPLLCAHASLTLSDILNTSLQHRPMPRATREGRTMTMITTHNAMVERSLFVHKTPSGPSESIYPTLGTPMPTPTQRKIHQSCLMHPYSRENTALRPWYHQRNGRSNSLG